MRPLYRARKQVIDDLPLEGDLTLEATLQRKTKKNWDYSKCVTNGESYPAPWAAERADIISRARK